MTETEKWTVWSPTRDATPADRWLAVEHCPHRDAALASILLRVAGLAQHAPDGRPRLTATYLALPAGASPEVRDT